MATLPSLQSTAPKSMLGAADFLSPESRIIACGGGAVDAPSASIAGARNRCPAWACSVWPFLLGQLFGGIEGPAHQREVLEYSLESLIAPAH
jgi:hypothetical protein